MIECVESMKLTFGVRHTLVFCMMSAYKAIWRYKNSTSVDRSKFLIVAGEYVTYVRNNVGFLSEEDYATFTAVEAMYKNVTDHKL